MMVTLLYFSARYRTIAADSNKVIGLPPGPSRSIAQGILLLGLTETNPDDNNDDGDDGDGEWGDDYDDGTFIKLLTLTNVIGMSIILNQP